jgi:hypothetical protein
MAATLSAATITPYSLNARVVPRPVTPEDVINYTNSGLPANVEVSGGLSTFAIGTPAYLEVEVAITAGYAATITGINWTLTPPLGSSAALTASPLPTNMPVFLPSDKLLYVVAPQSNSRMVLRPDVVGEYTVNVTVANTNGTTNVSASFNVGTYYGVYVCEGCHTDSTIGSITVPEIYTPWSTTAHASIFTEGVDGLLGTHYGTSCIKCHTTGYDTNASALEDGGFYGVQQADGWLFPTNLANTNAASTNFSSMPENLRSVANITCENCHGPGSQHILPALLQAEGEPTANYPGLDIPNTVGACEQCHDDAPTHPQGTQWYASDHAGGFSTAASIPSSEKGTTNQYCVRCHTEAGFIAFVSNSVAGNGIVTTTNTAYTAIGCQTCHEPHGLTTPTNDNYLIRMMASATFGDGTVITNGGEGNLCMNCHHSRNGSAVTNVMNYPLGLNTWAQGSSFGTHDGPQGDMLEGVNAITYGLSIPSSAHRISVTNSCVGCHMQTISSTNSDGSPNPGFLLSGGHTFEMYYTTYTTNGSTITTNQVDQVAVCNQCHGGITNFNFPVEDYANTGTILGVQTEVQILLNQLSTLLPNSSGVVDGTVKTSLSVKTNWTQAQLQAAYNWQFVENDGSLGIHNAPFATGLLNASIADLTGPSVPGSYDAWATNYFTSLTNANAADFADPAGDGVPNWLKYALGLNPNVVDKGLTVMPNGVVYANGNALGGNTPTNTLAISTAADITFDTVAGMTYQIQEVTSLSEGWQDVGNPIVATNTASMSYLTPTAGKFQQFFRVVSSPTP